MKCLRLVSFWRLRLHLEHPKNVQPALWRANRLLDIPNFGSGLSAVEGSAGGPPIDLLPIDLVDSSHDKGQDLLDDLAMPH